MSDANGTEFRDDVPVLAAHSRAATLSAQTDVPLPRCLRCHDDIRCGVLVDATA